METTAAASGVTDGKTNPDLAKERRRASFDTLQMTYFLYDGPEKVRRRRYVRKFTVKTRVQKLCRCNLAFSDPNIRQKQFTYLSRDEAYTEAMRKAVYITKRLKELNITDPVDANSFREASGAHEGSPLGLHDSMFSQTIASQSTPEQLEYWLPRCRNYEVIGTYAQTELGHGTFIRGLETNATFDPKTDEFVMNTPTLTSIKFWPGALGKTTNHAIVMAQVYTRGQHCGVFPVIVQTRSLTNHQPLPGITIGDIGPKFGYEAIDNGFLKLDNVRVPRQHLLMKHATVEKDGTFRRLASDRLTYGSMVLVRSYIVYAMGVSLSQACTIAIRYSAVRRQSKINPRDPEPQVLDYITQQYKLLPLLSTAYAYHIVSTEMMSMFSRISQDVQQGDLENLPQLHAMSAGLKSFTSWGAVAGIEQCRFACGGHGYAQLSGFPKIYKDVTPAVTYEGENTVMALQTARFVMKCYRNLRAVEKLPSFIDYLGEAQSNSKSPITSALNESHLLQAFQFRTTRYVFECARLLESHEKKGRTSEEAWNLTSVDLVKAAMAFCEAFVVKMFLQKLSTPGLDSRLRQVLVTLYRLYCCHSINQHLGDYLMYGYFTPAQARILRDSETSLMANVRSNAVALVDAFDFPDQILDSCLGREDGNVYEAMFDYAKNSPLNATEVHESYYKHLRGLVQAGRAQSKL